MRALIGIVIALLIGCEDTRRAERRAPEDPLQQYAAEQARKRKQKQAATARAMQSRCAGPTCLPDVTFTAVDGTTYSRDALDGKIVVLWFWASWSNPATLDAPVVARVWDRFEGTDVVMLAVSVEALDDHRLVDAALLLGIDLPVVAGDALSAGSIPDALPTTWVFDRHGARIHERVGRNDEATLVDWIERLRSAP